MIRILVSAAQFFWRATAGHRWRPWSSPYLRWRMETYTGQPAHTLRPRDFWRLALAERRQVGGFLRWLASMERLAEGGRP